MTAPLDINSFFFIRMVGDANTPAAHQQWVGVRVGVPPGTPLSPTQTTFLGLNGYARQDPEGQWEWMIQPAPDPMLMGLNVAPGPGGWDDIPSRNTWQGIFEELRRRGIGGIELVQAGTALYAAAVTNHIASQA